MITKEQDIPNYKKLFVAIWMILVVSSDIKVTINPYIHWIATFMLMGPVWISALNKRVTVHLIFLLAPSFLLISILISGTNDFPYAVFQTTKLFIILVCTLGFFLFHDRYIKIAFDSMKVASYINTILLMIGAVFLPFAASKMAPNRWGTVLNYPGSLCKIGLFFVVYSVYVLLKKKGGRSSSSLLLLSSLLLILFDGSRTAMLATFGAIVFVLIVILVELKVPIYYYVKIVSKFLILPLVLVLFVSMAFSNKIYNLFSAYASRVVEILNNLKANGIIKGLESSDPTRFQMINDAIKEISRHPIVGTGIGTTTTETIVGPMVVHNTYLQVWADMGILGIISYLVLTLGWVIFLPFFYKKFTLVESIETKAVLINSVFMLIYLAFNGLFHPLSTEWSEWIIFIISYAVFFRFLLGKSDWDRAGVQS